MHTIEIAKLYESQGYHEDAYQIYLKLEQGHSTSQTRAGINRMKMKITAASESSDNADDFDFHDLADGNLTDDDLTDGDLADGDLADGDGESIAKERIAQLCEKWINLIVLKHRLDRFKRFKSRLI